MATANEQRPERPCYLMVPMVGPWTLEIHPFCQNDGGALHDDAKAQVERSLAFQLELPKATGKGSRKVNEHRAAYVAWLRRVLATWCDASSVLRNRVRVVGIPAGCGERAEDGGR